jgi:hypothetical protein
MELMWHYTPSYRAAMILREGMLRPSPRNSFAGAESLVDSPPAR